ncbi:uncharacterized protein LOC124722424 [Schistocerca piceifrons]|uniref:uncharacterized protein LOC124722424 n=1 Tax=Schistocerca piceifrons TaxID=274613 RepID=UPI001F5EDBE6|nr:uncharacterized protein LOC124722424 [Schistocerca piceifrons]
MKFFLAFVLLHLSAFQETYQRQVPGVATVTGDPVRDDVDTEISKYDGLNMQNISAGSMEGTDRRNSSINATLLESDIAGSGSFSNDTTSEDGAEEKKPKYFHDDTRGIVAIFIMAIMVAGLFLSPVLRQYGNNYICKKPRTVQEQADFPPRYQDLLQRDYL